MRRAQESSVAAPSHSGSDQSLRCAGRAEVPFSIDQQQHANAARAAEAAARSPHLTSGNSAHAKT